MRAWPCHGLPRGTALGAVALLIGLTSCSPALDWREVELSPLKMLLPCKPDKAQRVLIYEKEKITVSMVGCKAADALFAVSHVKLAGNQQVSALIEAWSQSALTQIRANAELNVEKPNRLLRLSGIDRLQAAQTTGFIDEGGAIKAKLVWLSKGNDVFHIAIYAAKLTADMEEPLMESLRWMND